MVLLLRWKLGDDSPEEVRELSGNVWSTERQLLGNPKHIIA
jgi:hypothetical protein